MVQSIPPALKTHEELTSRSEDRATQVALLAWAEVDPARISQTWERVLPAVAAEVTAQQVRVADSAVRASRDVSVETGQYDLPEAFHDPRTLAGYGSQGVPLEDALYSPAIGVKSRIKAGGTVSDAMLYGMAAVSSMSSTIVADTGREAMQMDMITRKQTGYVRVVEAGACSRCIILAGKFFRWNKGFLRHPSCVCKHMPAKSEQWAKDEGWYADPYEAFNAMAPAEQHRVFGEFSAKAIRDGADIFQVVNTTSPRAGLYAGGRMTLEGTTRRGNFRRTSPYRNRLTPYGIYGDGSRSREQVIKALTDNGYILPGGQNPGGSIRGAGNVAKGASRATKESWRTGIRNPTNMGAMTEAEKRFYRAERNWQMVQAGLNPEQAGAAARWTALVEGRPAPVGGTLPTPLTDGGRARAEAAYRKFVLGLDGGDPALPPNMRPGR